MDEDNRFLDDDIFYPLDFKEELEHVVEVEEILEVAYGNKSGFASTSTFGETHFNILYYKSENERNEEGNGRQYGIDNECSNYQEITFQLI